MPQLHRIETAMLEGGEMTIRQIADATGLSSPTISNYMRKYPDKFHFVGEGINNYQVTRIYTLAESHVKKTTFERRAEKFPVQGLTKFAKGFKSLTERFN